MKTIQQNIKIKATDGNEIIVDNPIFSYIDPDFKKYELNEQSPETEATIFEIKKIEKSGTFKDIYSELGDLDKLVVTQSQILEFLKTNKLKKDVRSYFFLMRKKNEFFVADVSDDGTLGVCVRRFSNGFVWSAVYRLRVVVPQLALSNSESSPLDTLTLPSELIINGIKYIIK